MACVCSGLGQPEETRAAGSGGSVSYNLKVSSKSVPHSVAGAVAGILHGARSLRHAGNGSGSPQSGDQGDRDRPYLRQRGRLRHRVLPEFSEVTIDGQARDGHPHPGAALRRSRRAAARTGRAGGAEGDRDRARSGGRHRGAGGTSVDSPDAAQVPHPHVRLPDERARLSGWPVSSKPRAWCPRSRPMPPTSSCSTPAASARTPTPVSTASSAGDGSAQGAPSRGEGRRRRLSRAEGRRRTRRTCTPRRRRLRHPQPRAPAGPARAHRPKRRTDRRDHRRDRRDAQRAADAP